MKTTGFRKFIAVGAIVLASGWTATCWAQTASGLGAAGSAPQKYQSDVGKKAPFDVPGFAYHYRKKEKMHVYDCKQTSCARRSKVSFIYLKQTEPGPFSSYVKRRKKIEKQIRKWYPENVKIDFEAPLEFSISRYVSYSQRRTQTSPRGVMVFISGTLFGENQTISLISSGTDSEMARLNRNVFIKRLFP